jgi:hypothetical protein
MWLNSIIKIVVSRLRDANKRVNQTVLRDRQRGMTSLLLLLLPVHKYSFNSLPALDYNMVCLEAYYVCRLKKRDILKQLQLLVGKKLIDISEDTDAKKHVCIADQEALGLFEEYLALRSRDKTFVEATIPAELVTLLSNIAYVAQRSGKESASGTTLSLRALIADLKEGANKEKIEKNLSEMRRRGLVDLLPEEDDQQITFHKEHLSRIKKIQEWLPRFEAGQ